MRNLELTSGVTSGALRELNPLRAPRHASSFHSPPPTRGLRLSHSLPPTRGGLWTSHSSPSLTAQRSSTRGSFGMLCSINSAVLLSTSRTERIRAANSSWASLRREPSTFALDCTRTLAKGPEGGRPL